jgi:hypothetical protein
MTQPMSVKAIENSTGKSWEEWLKFFKKIDAEKLTHKEIAQKVYAAGTPGWWSQMVTVAYEQHIGRRVAGQDCNGEYSVSVGRTVDGTMDNAMERWVSLVGEQKEFSDIAISRGPDVSKTEKWRYWRSGLSDGSVVNVNIYEKAPDKAALSIQHEKLESTDQVEHWRTYWKAFTTKL